MAVEEEGDERCFRCQHARHISECGAPMELESIQWNCNCVGVTFASMDGHTMRTRDVLQQADIREATQADWDQKTPAQQREIKRRARTGGYRKL